MNAPENIFVSHHRGDKEKPTLIVPSDVDFLSTEYTRTDIHEAALNRIKKLEEAAKGQCIIVNQAREQIKKLEAEKKKLKETITEIEESESEATRILVEYSFIIKKLKAALNAAVDDIDKFGEKEPIDIPTCQESFKTAEGK